MCHKWLVIDFQFSILKGYYANIGYTRIQEKSAV